MEAKNDPNMRKKGLVKGVPTGDTVIFQGPAKNGIPLEKTLRLNGIRAPTLADIDRPERVEEPFAFQAREFLRKKLVGKQVFFYTEYKIGDREYGRVIVDDVDIGEALLAEGLATLLDDVKPEPANYDKYTIAADKAFKAKKGIYTEDKKVEAAGTRKLNKIDDLANFAEKNKGKTVKAIVEEFRSGLFSLYLPEVDALVKLGLHAITIPVMGFKAAQDVRCFIDTNFLQREVEVAISGYDERGNYLTGNIKSVENPSYNLIKELLKEGHGRLNPESYKLLEVAEHKAAKQAQDEAQRLKLRCWGNFDTEKRQSSTVEKDEEFPGKIVEVNSGDSITVENLKNGEVSRFFLANIRAPGMGNPKRSEASKPWGWESREFARHQAIGKKVRVEVEFSRKVQLKGEDELPSGEERDLTFVSVILPNDKNLSELIVAAGLATVAPPRAEDSFTKYMKQLTDAEEEAKKKKLGLHSSKTPLNPAKYIDYSQPRQSSKARQFFDFTKNEPVVHGVVEAALSGSLFKIRLDKQNCYILFSLGGIRTYSMEKNVPQYEKFAKEALKFSKDQILQRDVELELNSCTPKGLIQGSLLVGKKNFAHSLIEQGLAYVESLAKAEQKYAAQYRAVEKIAEEKKIGIWGSGIPVRSAGPTRTSYTVKPLNETKVVTVVDVVTATEFYVHSKDAKKTIVTIEAELAKAAKGPEAKLEQPVKKGIPCIAKFSDDGKWYRARIDKLISSTKFGVVFTDYGNYDEVHYDDLRKISPSLLSIAPLAQRCGLAYGFSADKKTETGEEAGERLRELIWEKEVTIQFVYEDGTTKYGVVYEGKAGDIKNSANSKLIGEGLLRLDEGAVQIPTEQLIVLREQDEKARLKKNGGWGNNDFYEEEDDY